MHKIYEFKEQDAYDFANHMRIQAKPFNDELRFLKCPYCNPKKDKGTFSINLKTGQFKCLRASCGVSGNMITLAKDFDFSLGYEVDEYYRPQKKFRKFKTPKEPIKPKPKALEYLKSRGISEKTAEKYEISVKESNQSTLVFPFFDEKGIIRFIKYRDTDFFPGKTYIKDGQEESSPKEWCERDCKPILFGMKQCNDKFDRLIITEGQLDSLSVDTAGIENAVSVPNGAKGFTWIPYCWNWINQFEEVIVFGDYEKGKITLLDELSHRLKIIVKHVREEDYLDCKDANAILQKYGVEQVRKCVENAVIVPINKVVELADVEDVDIFKIEKLKTGIRQLDRLLYGGIPFGGLVLISGKPGEGKSTLASQILLNARVQGYKCLAYSGELPNYMFKAWMNFQTAGPAYVFEYQNEFGDTNYTISKANKKLISEWYRGETFIYDNAAIDGDEKESLVKTVENTICQYGTRVILLDNLMTALDLEVESGNDKYERQSVFVKRLARLALRHNVLIILVAHKRKNNFSQNENDEISGSGDISNLALLTIAYEKGKDLDDSQRLIKISKNRLFGRVNTIGWIANFDEKSKRIYINSDDLNVDFGWNKEFDGFYEINQETPFD